MVGIVVREGKGKGKGGSSSFIRLRLPTYFCSADRGRKKPYDMI